MNFNTILHCFECTLINNNINNIFSNELFYMINYQMSSDIIFIMNNVIIENSDDLMLHKYFCLLFKFACFINHNKYNFMSYEYIEKSKVILDKGQV